MLYETVRDADETVHRGLSLGPREALPVCISCIYKKQAQALSELACLLKEQNN